MFSGTVERTVGIDGRITPVRRDQVMQIMFFRQPIPRGNHDVTLDSLRPWRLGMRQLAFSYAVRPISKIAYRRRAEFLDDDIEHQLTTLPGLNSTEPGLLRTGEI